MNIHWTNVELLWGRKPETVCHVWLHVHLQYHIVSIRHVNRNPRRLSFVVLIVCVRCVCPFRATQAKNTAKKAAKSSAAAAKKAGAAASLYRVKVLEAARKRKLDREQCHPHQKCRYLLRMF